MVTGLVVGNTSLVCQHGLYHRHGIWTNGNPLHAPTPLLLFQIGIISVVSNLLHFALQPLGQLRMTSQLLVRLPSFLPIPAIAPQPRFVR